MAVGPKQSNLLHLWKATSSENMRLPSHGGNFNKFCTIVGFSLFAFLPSIYVYMENTSEENSFMLTFRKLKKSRLTKPY